MELDYRNDIVIDSSALDVEWLQQGELGIKYGKNWAAAKEARQLAYEHIKVIRAGLRRKINENPAKYIGVGVKLTNDSVDAAIAENKEHSKLYKEYIKLQYDEDMAEIAKKEISITRKASLQNMVDLFKSNYFAGPSVPRELSVEVQKRYTSQKSNAGVSAKLNKKKKKVRKTK